MQYEELVTSIQQLGKDPARLIFEDELTGIPNRRFLHNYFEHKVRWEDQTGAPVSLLMMDVDYFKKINDTHGHEAGDQALVHIARILKTVAGEQYYPVRYSGDEFMILMPNGRKEEAVALGERLVERVSSIPLRVGRGAELRLTLSVGVATAPDDAQNGKALVGQADTALYRAKHAGRNRVADVSDVLQQGVSDKTALQQLSGLSICSREEQMAKVQEVIQQFDQGESRFVLVEGATGLGKSTFLEAIRRKMQATEACLVKTAGSLQENYRPYYVATSILISLLGQRDDKGQAAFESMNEKEIGYLGTLLPQLHKAPEFRLAPDEAVRREGIFSAVTKFVYLLLDYRPLVLLIDDLHFADEASLALVKRLLGSVSVFVCGTSAAPGAGQAEQSEQPESAPPLERFLADDAGDLEIAGVLLNPLTPAEIASTVQTVFSPLSAPADMVETLAAVTQGNPLFLNELLRKLVLDRKLKPVGQQWVLDSLNAQDLPKSVDEMVKQKINALDDEGKNLLAQTSAFGEDVSLSVLTGSSDAMESKVLEFLDQAVELGLLNADYNVNDETIRFVGKQVMDVAYNNLGEAQKRVLHERVGSYQEGLFKKRLLPSAAPLVYHFTRSANRQKASTYDRVVTIDSKSLFNAQEASSYKTEEAASTDTPLDAISFNRVPTLVRSLQTCVRNMRLYKADSKHVVSPTAEFAQAMQQILEKNEQLNLVRVKNSLVVNGQKVGEAGEYKFVAEVFHTFLESVWLRGISFQRGVTEEQLNAMLRGFASAKPDDIDDQYWHRFTAEKGLTHVYLKQAGGHPKPAAIEAASAELMASAEVLAEPDVMAEAPEVAPVEMAPVEMGPVETLRPAEVSRTVETARPEARSLEATPVRREPTMEEELAAQPVEALLANFPDLVAGILRTGAGPQLGALLTRVLEAIWERDEAMRGKVLEAVKTAFVRLPLGFQQEFVRQAADPLLKALDHERNPVITGTVAGLIRQMASSIIPFGEYKLAGRLMMALSALLQSLEATDTRMAVLAEVMERPLEAATQKMLVDDLRSADSVRQEHAAQLLGGFGVGAMLALIEVVKNVGDLRVRQLSAALLAQLGARAAKVYKKEMVLEITPEERMRMLEVSDTVTRALRTEVTFALGDAHPGVREAAYRLAERLKDGKIMQHLVRYAKQDDAEVSVGAIKCLGNIKPKGLVTVLTGIMQASEDPTRQIACCQALGQVADPAAIGPLTKMLTPKGFFLFRKRRPSEVRAAAAYALAQIPDPRVFDVLATLANDQDPRIRQLAQSVPKD